MLKIQIIIERDMYIPSGIYLCLKETNHYLNLNSFL
jgi:hypothetical protein